MEGEEEEKGSGVVASPASKSLWRSVQIFIKNDALGLTETSVNEASLPFGCKGKRVESPTRPFCRKKRPFVRIANPLNATVRGQRNEEEEEEVSLWYRLTSPATRIRRSLAR